MHTRITLIEKKESRYVSNAQFIGMRTTGTGVKVGGIFIPPTQQGSYRGEQVQLSAVLPIDEQIDMAIQEMQSALQPSANTEVFLRENAAHLQYNLNQCITSLATTYSQDGRWEETRKEAFTSSRDKIVNYLKLCFNFLENFPEARAKVITALADTFKSRSLDARVSLANYFPNIDFGFHTTHRPNNFRR